MPICEECKYLVKTSYEYEEYDCEAGIPEEDCREKVRGFGCSHTQRFLEKRYNKIQDDLAEMYEGYVNAFLEEEKVRNGL